jgi:hypothetical protein
MVLAFWQKKTRLSWRAKRIFIHKNLPNSLPVAAISAVVNLPSACDSKSQKNYPSFFPWQRG